MKLLEDTAGGKDAFWAELPFGRVWVWVDPREDARRAQVGVWIDQRLVDRDLIHALPDGAIEWQDLEGEAADLAREAVLAGVAKGLVDWLLGHGPEPMRPALALALTGGKHMTDRELSDLLAGYPVFVEPVTTGQLTR
jgi:hypothetical protein